MRHGDGRRFGQYRTRRAGMERDRRRGCWGRRGCARRCRARSNQTGQGGAGRDWAGRDWAGRDWAGRDWAGRDGAGRDWAGPGWAGRDGAGRDWAGPGWAGRDWARRDWAAGNRLQRRQFARHCQAGDARPAQVGAGLDHLVAKRAFRHGSGSGNTRILADRDRAMGGHGVRHAARNSTRPKI